MKEKLLKSFEWGKRNISWVLSILLVSVYFIVAFWGMGICFETNDDRYISDILSGIIANEPNAHVIHINYLLSFALMLLYKCTVNVAWYGLFMIMMHLCAYVVISRQLIQQGKGFIGKVIISGILGIVFLSHTYMLGEIQFTSTAALLAIAGYVCLMNTKKKGLLFFFVFELFACMLRIKAMLMIQPIGMSVLACMLIVESKPWKDKIKWIYKVGGILITVFIICFLGNVIGYPKGTWEDYERYNVARAELFDIYGMPSYEEAELVLVKYGVTEDEYNAFMNYTILDWDISVECIEELAEYAKENRNKSFVFSDMVEKIKLVFEKESYLGICRLALLVTVMALGLVLLLKQWKFLLPLFCVIISYFVLIIYLIWQGRAPERVMMPLAFATTIMSLMILFKGISVGKNAIVQVVGLIAMAIMVVGVSRSIIEPQYWYVNQLNANKEIYITGMQELEDYCRRHPENRYLVEAFSASYCQGNVLDIRLNQQKNSIVTGCWYSNSPVMRQKLKSYLDVETEQIKLIINAEGVAHENVVIEYLENKIGKVAIEEACFSVSHGGVYKVYGFYDAQ